MKHLSTIFAVASCLSAASLVSAGQKTTNNVYQNGNNNRATPQTSQSISPQTQVKAHRRRDLAELFRREAADAAAAGGVTPLSQEDIIGMINNNQQFPPALEAVFQGSALSQMFQRPANLNPPPADLANHPATKAIEILKAKEIPPPILAAAKAKWGPAGGAGAPATPKLRRWAAPVADPDAYLNDEDFGYDLMARSTYFDDDSALAMLPRSIELDDLALYARDALALADADIDDAYEIYARSPSKDPFTVNNVEKLVDLIQTDKNAAAAVADALNADPKLQRYASDLQDGFGS